MQSTLIQVKSEIYCEKIKHRIKNSNELTDPIQKWEFLKYKIYQFTITLSKTIKKDRDNENRNCYLIK